MKIRRENYEIEEERLLLTCCLHVMEYCFDVMLCSNLDNKNSEASRIKWCSLRLLVSHPCLR